MITATAARYIKLGPRGVWEDLCLADATLRFGYGEVPAEIAISGDQAALRAHFIVRGLTGGAATDSTREVADFYDGDGSALWITFSRGEMWWCFAEPAVIELGPDNPTGARLRAARGGWSNRSEGGALLRMADLSGRLTRTAGYRRTICGVTAFDYLLACLNDRALPEVLAAHAARDELITAGVRLIRLMTWQDFELLVGLVFSTTGWRRVGAVGGTQKTVDIELMLPSTGERAFVQAKSETAQAEFDDYAAAFEVRDDARMFYVYHTSKSPIAAARDGVTLVGPHRLAEMVLEAGLFDWLLRRLA